MAATPFPLLSLLIFLPLAAGLLLFVVRSAVWVRRFALAFGLLELMVAVGLLGLMDKTSADMQWVERVVWIPTLNIHYLLGVDGISAPFLPLTALVNVCVILASWHSVHTLPKLYFALLLWLESATVGVFCALDLGLFFLFWELTLPPLYFLMSLWGIGPERRHAAMKYTLMMLAGGVPLLVGIVLLGLTNTHDAAPASPMGLNFDYFSLLQTSSPLALQTLIFGLLLLGFAVKAPLFPFHVWLPSAAMQGPVGVTALLMGLKLGLYGIIRFAVPLAPQAAQNDAKVLSGIGVFCALYGALIALKQTNLRRLLAYASISHVGLVLVGIASVNIQGIQGAVFQLFNFGLVACGIFLLTGCLQQRFRSTDFTALGGLAQSMPLLSGLWLAFGLSGIGIPGTNGFAAEHLILLGAFRAHHGMGLAALLAGLLAAGYLLKAFQTAFLGQATRPVVRDALDLRPRELALAGLLALPCLMLGLFPQALLSYSQKPLQAWVARLQSGHSLNIASAEKTPGGSRQTD